VPEGIIKLNKRLSSLEDLEGDGVKLHFEDGAETIADLVIGGDGIRSVCQSLIATEISTKVLSGCQRACIPRSYHQIHRLTFLSTT
jgi:salicylate hydroxylase